LYVKLFEVEKYLLLDVLTALNMRILSPIGSISNEKFVSGECIYINTQRPL